MTGAAARDPEPRLVAARAFALFCALSLFAAWKTPFPGAFDELQHVSYAAHLQENRRVLPDFREQKTLSADDLRQWTEKPNYVGHPSPFYLLMAAVLDRSKRPEEAVFLPRLASNALLYAAVALCLLARAGACASGAGADRRTAFVVFCFAVALCPKLLAISSQATNDSLAVLAGALVFAGLHRSRGRDRWCGPLVASGLALAFWSKPNAAVVVGSCVAAFLLAAGHANGKKTLAWSAAGALVGFVPYAPMLWHYGKLVPVTHEHVEDLTGHQAADLASYIPEFFLFLGMSWSLAQSASALNVALFWMLILASTLAGGLAWRRRQTLDATIAAAGPAAFAVTLPIHLAYGATSLGYSIPAASFRYYLPLWPFLAHTVAFGVAAAARPWQRFLFASVLFAAIAAGWLSR